MATLSPEFERPSFVSVWAGTFPDTAAAEAFFTEGYEQPEGGEPVWTASRFQSDLGLGFFPPWHLEIQFPGPPRRSVAELLENIPFSETFGAVAAEAAAGKGVSAVDGVACVFNFDYTLKPGWAERVGPLWFLGAFPFVYREPSVARYVSQVADRTDIPATALQVVLGLATDYARGQPIESGELSAREFCEFIRSRVGEIGPLLRAHGLQTSEAVGRAVAALSGSELLRTSPTTGAEAEFAGLFDLREVEETG